MTEKPGKSSSGAGDGEPIVIRKYANRRLYNTDSGQFVTLDELRKLIADGESLVVIDAKTGDDITSSILAQIIAEQGSRGERVLPDELLRQFIGFYEKGMSENLGAYLKKSMEAYTENWEQMEKLGEMGRRNMEIVQKSLASMFGATPGGAKPAETRTESRRPDSPPEDLVDQVGALRDQLRAMQEKLDSLTGNAPKQTKRPGRKSKR
jgi:polyhydroxyalkanoate synthesis repressor PhaR